MRFCKNASLNLSINAIVIIILAMTMLGLGLGFIRMIFSKAEKELSSVGGEIEKQMVEQLEKTGKVVDLNKISVDLKPGEKGTLYIGYKNKGSQDIYFAIVNYEDAIGSQDGDLDLACTALKQDSCEGKGVNVYLKANQKVLPGDVEVNKILIETAASAPEDTYIYELKVGTGPSIDEDDIVMSEILTFSINVALG